MGKTILMILQSRLYLVFLRAFKRYMCVSTSIKLDTRHQTDSWTGPEATELVALLLHSSRTQHLLSKEKGM